MREARKSAEVKEQVLRHDKSISEVSQWNDYFGNKCKLRLQVWILRKGWRKNVL